MKRLLLLALAGSLAAGHGGCFWLAVGGAGYAGYEVGTDDRSAGTQLDDAAITSKVKSKLLADDHVKGLDVNVDTFEGVVTLHGHVQDDATRRRAVEIARGVKGVRDVRDNLRTLD